MKQVTAQILEHTRITPHHCLMRLKAPSLGRAARPGQFVEVRCGDRIDPLLRRPLGIHRIERGGISMLYEVVGKGTEILAGMRPGLTLDVIGPLGNGFYTGPRVQGPGSRVIVAGGIGAAPMVALAEALVKGAGKKRRNAIVLLGARTKSHVVCEDVFRKLGCDVRVTTDDGSKGAKGLVTDPLGRLLSDAARRLSAIYACGPTPMLQSVAALAKEHAIPCQVSLEEHMACGVGVCLGCPVKVRKDLVDTEYRMVCKDGPVFDAEQIVW